MMWHCVSNIDYGCGVGGNKVENFNYDREKNSVSVSAVYNEKSSRNFGKAERKLKIAINDLSVTQSW